ncbi:MAG: 7TM diverse intracellular signaling domain-containing protein [Ferruginibacter sp.]
MKRFVILVIFYFAISFCKAQVATDSNSLSVASITEVKSLLKISLLYVDSSSSLLPDEVLQKPFKPLTDFNARKNLSPDLITCTFYLKIPLYNNSENDITGYVNPGWYFTGFDMYKLKPQSVMVAGEDSILGYKKITMAAGESGYVLLKLKPLKNDINSINPLFINESFIDHYTTYYAAHKTDHQIYGLVLSGILFMMILFMFTTFIISQRREFMFNSIYSLCMFLLVFLNSVMPRSSSDFTYLYYSYFDFFLLVTGTIFYFIFTRRFLNTKENYRLLDIILKNGERFVLILLGVYTFLNFFTNTYLPQYYLENFMKIFILLIGLVFIYLALKQKNRLLNYIAAGNAMLVLFSVISLIILLLKIKPTEIYFSSLFYYNTGIIFELAFFLMGLTYKNRTELINGIKEQEALKLEAEKRDFENQLTVMKAQQEERNRISADMHDDLGAGMTTIRLYSELAKSKLINNPIPEIEKISSSANELLGKMNAIIWSMSSSNDSLSNMIAYIRSYALEYFEDTGINCRINIPEKLPNIQVVGEIRRNVFLVVKEALNNILKHAKATEVNIILTRVEDGLTLYIQDNGTGINMDKLRQFGNGLKNMQKRMRDIDADFTIENKNGTLITMHRKITATEFF